ncbi:MAG: tryptophan-rich sensory protein [Elusimicrobia bacterium]|nr:tryptophan-rich sensory protein [Elusimicrobiota bacterium]
MINIKPIEIVKLSACIGACLLAGVIGSIFTSSSVQTWYPTLIKPSFNPPDWVFAPVWTALYILMGISAYLILNKGFENKSVRISLLLFDTQLMLNILWSFLFFYLHSPFLAFVEIIILWFMILVIMLRFFKLSKTAGLLLVPYILWVTFAAVLNFYIFKLNP